MKLNNKFKNKKIIYILIIIVVAIICLLSFRNNKLEYMQYKDFSEKIENDNIETVTIEDDIVKFKQKSDNTPYYTNNPHNDNFEEKLLIKGINIEINSEKENMDFIANIIFFGVFSIAIALGIYKLYEMNQKTFKVIKHTNVKFEDIAGMERTKKRHDTGSRCIKKQ